MILKFRKEIPRKKQNSDENVSLNRMEISSATKKAPMKASAIQTALWQGVERKVSLHIFYPAPSASAFLFESARKLAHH